MAGLRAYQQAQRRPRPPAAPAIARAGRATLRDFGGSGPPVLFVPSLINPPDVLDISEERSLLRWLSGQGVRPLLIDWGTPQASDRAIDVAGHVEQMLLPLIAELGEPPLLAGYCLGATMAVAAAARARVRGLALIAGPWRFAGFPEAERSKLCALWHEAEPGCDALGLMPIEVLQASFWQLDPARTIEKFEAFARTDPDSDAARAFVTLEDWANDGPPLTYSAARELFDDFFETDLPGSGRWRVGGAAIDPATIACPILDIVSTTDRIVPAASALGLGERLTVDLGHVGMVVGSRAKAALWQPLAAWLCST